MRHLFVIIDMSSAMEDQDLKPNRLFSTIKVDRFALQSYCASNQISFLFVKL